MKIKYRLLKIILLTILLGFLMNFSIKRHNNKKIEEINITIGNSDKVHFITDDMIKNVINKTSKNGEKVNQIKDLNIIKTEEKLDENPFIAQSNVYVDLNGTVNVSVVQKVPIARIKTKKDEFYIDNEGNKFPLSSNYSYPCMTTGGNILPEEYKKLAQLCKLISVDKLLKNHVIAIEKDNQNSYNFLLNQEGVYIEYGNLENNRQKLTNLKEFYRQYLNNVGFGAYKKISVKYDNQIVATKR